MNVTIQHREDVSPLSVNSSSFVGQAALLKKVAELEEQNMRNKMRMREMQEKHDEIQDVIASRRSA